MPSTYQAMLPQVRERLQKLRAELLERAQCVHCDLTRRKGALSADFSEQAVEAQNDAALQVIGATAVFELAEIDEALQRLERGEYGVCRDCGQAISPRRLAAVPQAVTCTMCAR